MELKDTGINNIKEAERNIIGQFKSYRHMEWLE